MVLSRSNLNNPFHFLTTVNIILINFVTSLFTEYVIMFNEPNSTIILKDVIPNDAYSNTNHSTNWLRETGNSRQVVLPGFS